MASLTVRQLDETLKRRLRLRAARNGRSVEDEVRTILRGAAEDEPAAETPAPVAHTRRAAPAEARTKRVLLIIGGGIAAYKSLDLIRRLKERGVAVRCILTKAAEHFVTPLSAGAIVGERVFTDLFDPAHEFDVGHIRLARETDLVVVAPATADLMAKLAGGHADDLATAVLLATTAKILIAPAMNPRMWANKATQRNLAQLVADGFSIVGPNAGEMAEAGESGIGRMAEPLEIAEAAGKLLARPHASLSGKRVLVTPGPTIDVHNLPSELVSATQTASAEPRPAISALFEPTIAEPAAVSMPAPSFSNATPAERLDGLVMPVEEAEKILSTVHAKQHQKV